VQIDRIQAVVRPRNAWESIDLGISMVRYWWKPLSIIWLTFIIPIILAITLITGIYDMNYPFLIIWWLKPLFDRIILHFLSRALFGELPRLSDIFTTLPTLIFKTRLILGLTLERFSLTRSFSLPIYQLEDLKFSMQGKRVQILLKGNINIAQYLTISCFVFQWLIYFSLLGIIYLLLPESYQANLDNWLSIFQNNPIWWLDIGKLFFEILAMILIESIYVAAGFALYLNQRTHLESWDIELTFHQLAQRLLSK